MFFWQYALWCTGNWLFWHLLYIVYNIYQNHLHWNGLQKYSTVTPSIHVSFIFHSAYVRKKVNFFFFVCFVYLPKIFDWFVWTVIYILFRTRQKILDNLKKMIKPYPFLNHLPSIIIMQIFFFVVIVYLYVLKFTKLFFFSFTLPLFKKELRKIFLKTNNNNIYIHTERER